MKKLILILLTLTFIVACKKDKEEKTTLVVNYPKTKTVDTVDTYFDVEVKDQDDQNQVTVRSIVTARFGKRFTNKSPLLNDVLSLSKHIRDLEKQLTKLPSLAELLDWIDLLLKSDLDVEQGLREQIDLESLKVGFIPTFFKTIDDQKRSETWIDTWWQEG